MKRMKTCLFTTVWLFGAGCMGLSAENALEVVPAVLQPSASDGVLTLKMTSDATRSAWQLDIDLPVGMQLTGATRNAAPSTHQVLFEAVASARANHNTYRVLLFGNDASSTNNQAALSGDLLSLQVKTSAMAEGVYPVYVHDVLMDYIASPQGNAVHQTTSVPMATSYVTVAASASALPNAQCLTVEGLLPAFVTTAVNGNVTLTSLDLRAATSVGGSLALLNPNTVVYAASAKGYQNEVVDGVCANLTVTENYSFGAAEAFTATEALYNRTMARQWGSICLPFDVAIDATEPYDFYAVSSVSNDELSLQKITGTLTAGTPAVVRRNEAETGIAIVCYDASVKAGAANTLEAVGGLTPTATFVPVEITSGYYVTNNVFYNAATFYAEKQKTVKIAPFRAYYEGSLPGNAPSLRIAYAEEDALEQLEADASDAPARVVYQNGQMFILRGGERYNLLFQRK